MRENGNGGAGWGEKEEMQLWIEKGLNKRREWRRKDGLSRLAVGAELTTADSPKRRSSRFTVRKTDALVHVEDRLVSPRRAQQDKGELVPQWFCPQR